MTLLEAKQDINNGIVSSTTGSGRAPALLKTAEIGYANDFLEARMSRPRTGPNERAHIALEDWASFLLTTLSSQGLGYQIAQLDVERVQTPAHALIPKIAFTPYNIRAIENWYEQASIRLKTTAYMYYLADIQYKKQVTQSQHKRLIANVSSYLTGLA